MMFVAGRKATDLADRRDRAKHRDGQRPERCLVGMHGHIHAPAKKQPDC